MNQKTIQTSFEIRGIGLHSGKEVTLRLESAVENNGITFKRLENLDAKPLPALASNVISTQRCTVLGNEDFKVGTIEHLLSALYALGIDNINILTDSSELPAMDGCAVSFYNALKSCGIKELSAPKKVVILKEPFIIHKNDSTLIALPYEGKKFTAVLDYPGTLLGTQACIFDLDKESYIDEIAPARTFAFMSEIKALLENNLAKGGDFNNALVIDEDSYSSPLKFANEPVRHKCLDLIGDIALCGKLLFAHVIAIKPGHSINTQLALEIEKNGGLKFDGHK